jgi:hypothetical protein
MNRLISFSLLLSFICGASVSVLAEPECMRFVPAVGKVVAVPCDEGAQPDTPAPPAAVPAQPEATPPTAARPPPAEGGRKLDAEFRTATKGYQEVMTMAQGDERFRGKYCRLLATLKMINAEKDARQLQTLRDQYAVWEKELGKQAVMFNHMFDESLTKAILDYPMDNAQPRGAPFRQTPLGATFTNSLNEAKKLSCECLRNESLTVIECCDRCDKAALQGRFEEAIKLR